MALHGRSIVPLSDHRSISELRAMIHWLSGNAPAPPYYAVVFSSHKHTPRDGYQEMDDATMHAAERMPGYLGHQSVSNGDRTLFISYWQDEQAIAGWRDNDLHRSAKQQGKAEWYDRYDIQICRVEYANSHVRSDGPGMG